ncbi:MAG: DUF2183 domain-containing protein [Candidatus Ancillula sp.]|jgi:phosphatidate phosphatase APP1|nr:DUF2183 domain-containing protein [Candidatus Ancillula sp.]
MNISKIEDWWVRCMNSLFVKRRKYIPKITPYTCYGNQEEVKILCRVVLGNPKPKPSILHRGFRTLFTAQAPGVRVKIRLGEVEKEFVTDRGGYVNEWVKIESVDKKLKKGWHDIEFELAEDYELPRKFIPEKNRSVDYDKQKCIIPVEKFHDIKTSKILIIGKKQKMGIISDLDDTVLVSQVPKIFMAMWTVLGSSPHKRKHVPGMPELFDKLREKFPNIATFFLSATPWNFFPATRKFLAKHNFPFAPLILRDLGPNSQGKFEHADTVKNAAIDELFSKFPNMKWILIGDDGQKDPMIYRRTAKMYPGKIVAIFIRQMSVGEKLVDASTWFNFDNEKNSYVPIFYSADGFGLSRAIENLEA